MIEVDDGMMIKIAWMLIGTRFKDEDSDDQVMIMDENYEMREI